MPEEIGLDLGIEFNAGAVFAWSDSEAAFKESLKWKSVKDSQKTIQEKSESVNIWKTIIAALFFLV